jgi:hypothetical protein
MTISELFFFKFVVSCTNVSQKKFVWVTLDFFMCHQIYSLVLVCKLIICNYYMLKGKTFSNYVFHSITNYVVMILGLNLWSKLKHLRGNGSRKCFKNQSHSHNCERMSPKPMLCEYIIYSDISLGHG